MIGLVAKESQATALHCAAATQSPQAASSASLLLTCGAAVDAKDVRGDTPLMVAVKNTASLDIIRVLLLADADPNVLDSEGLTAIQIACANGDADIADLLIKSGAIIDRALGPPGSLPPLHAAARRGHADICRLIINRGVTIDLPNAAGNRPLHVAAFGRHQNVVKLLLELNCDVNALDSSHQTALMMSAIQGDDRIVTLLLAHGADPNIATLKTLWTALHLAARENHANVVRSIASDRRTNINLADAQRRTALHWSCFRGDMASILLMLENGADPLVQDGNGHTAVEVAMAKKYKEIAELLMSRIG